MSFRGMIMPCDELQDGIALIDF